LRKQGLASIYLDAFAVDYLESPFVAVAGAFSQAAEKARRAEHPAYFAFVNAASKVGKTLGGTAAKIAIKAATFGLVGSSEIESLAEIRGAIADAAGERAEAAVKELIEEHAQKEKEISELKTALADFPSLLSNEEARNDRARLVVVVDELDRCRPDFALGMVEAIKHFFGVSDVHFVLVTNRDHLIRSIIHRYGSFESAEEYLRKFYDYQIFYDQDYSRHGAPQIAHVVRRLADGLLGDLGEKNDIAELMGAAARAHRLTLRDLENVFANLSLAYAAVRSNEFRPSVLVTFLAFLKSLEPGMYAQVKAGNLHYAKLNERLFDRGNWGDINVERLRKVFEFYMDPNLNESSEEWRSWGRELWNFNIERLRVVPYICNSILDRFALAEVPT
jgi:hypothetical protein